MLIVGDTNIRDDCWIPNAWPPDANTGVSPEPTLETILEEGATVLKPPDSIRV